MPNLKNSRGKFFEVHKMPRDRTFWHYFLEQVGRLDEIPPEQLQKVSQWKPERSNCPELTATLEDLIENIPPEWKEIASNIFVGRVFDGEVNASAWTNMKAGIIEINLQYTFILSAYVAAFDQYVESLRLILKGIGLDSAEQLVSDLDNRLTSTWSQLDDSRSEWMDARLLAGGNPALLHLAPPDRVQPREDVVVACEEFIIAHELAHHLLGHTTSRKDGGKAKVTVDEVVDAADLHRHMETLNGSQVKELRADILAFMIMANVVDYPAPFGRLYRAILGSTISLLALAHVTDTWVATGNDESHPGIIRRYNVIEALTEWLSVNKPRGEVGDHPLGLISQLGGLYSIAINRWLCQSYPDRVGRIGVLDTADALLTALETIEGRIPG